MIKRLFTIRGVIATSIVILAITYWGQSRIASQDSQVTTALLYLPYVLSSSSNETEPNNTSDKANGPLQSGIFYTGYHNDESDYYKFHADSSGKITVNFSSNYAEGIRNKRIVIQLYYQSAKVENLVGEAKIPPYIVTHEGDSSLYYVRVFTDQCCLDSTKSYALNVSFPQATPTPTPTGTLVPPTSTATNTQTLTDSPTPTPTNTPTPTETQLPYTNWFICWHGTDGHEVLVAYPLNEARTGIELTMPLVRPWSGETADLANDSLKMCIAAGVWYGAEDTSADPPWFPQVSYVRFGENQVLVCWEIPGCKGPQAIMDTTGAPPSEIVSLLHPPIETGVHILGFMQSNPLQTPSSPTPTNTPTISLTPTSTPTSTPTGGLSSSIRLFTGNASVGGNIAIYDAIGQLIHNFSAFSIGSGVNLAAGDVDRDYQDEVIVGKNTGSNHIVIWEDNGVQVRSFPAGNSDGFTVAACNIGSYEWRNKIVLGSSPVSINTVWLYDANGDKSGWFTPFTNGSGANVACGDIDGDSIDEIVVGKAKGQNGVVILEADGTQIGYFDAFQEGEGVNVATGDIDGDGVDEIVTSKGSGGSQVIVFDTTTYCIENRMPNECRQTVTPALLSDAAGLRVAIVNIDSDPMAELALSRVLSSSTPTTCTKDTGDGCAKVYLFEPNTKQIIRYFSTIFPESDGVNVASHWSLPVLSPQPTIQNGYNFETDIQKWTTSEGESKKAILETTKRFVYSGAQALRLVTELRWVSNEVFRHTEAVAYFNNAVPESIGSPGPYNLTGKSISCFVYLPPGLASIDPSQAYISLFVKDKDFRNQFSDPIDIVPSNVNHWLQLALTIGVGDNTDEGFKSAEVNALGIRIDLHDGATLNYTGSLYIDHCAIEYP